MLVVLGTACQDKCAPDPGVYQLTFNQTSGNCAASETSLALQAFTTFTVNDQAVCGPVTTTENFSNDCSGETTLTISIAAGGLTGSAVVNEQCANSTCQSTFNAVATLITTTLPPDAAPQPDISTIPADAVQLP